VCGLSHASASFPQLDYDGQLMTTRAPLSPGLMRRRTPCSMNDWLRAYDGMHFRAAVDAGAALGKSLAQGTSSRYIGTRRP
jgi:hypothetical protein